METETAIQRKKRDELLARLAEDRAEIRTEACLEPRGDPTPKAPDATFG